MCQHSRSGQLALVAMRPNPMTSLMYFSLHTSSCRWLFLTALPQASGDQVTAGGSLTYLPIVSQTFPQPAHVPPLSCLEEVPA